MNAAITPIVSETKSQGKTLEQRLFHRLHNNHVRAPSIKEFKEAFQFVNLSRKCFGSDAIDVVLDVAGGHGALAALFLILTKASRAVVIDPANVGDAGVQKAWGEHFLFNKQLIYRHEGLRTGLPAEIEQALQTVTADRILVTACHACQHLSDETLEICIRYGVHVALMPCCQKDPSLGSHWKAFSKKVQIPIEKLMDILLAGKAMSWSCGRDIGVCYDVRIKLIDPLITPQNRLILCKAQPIQGQYSKNLANAETLRSRKLEKAYERSHVMARDLSASRHISTSWREREWIVPFTVGLTLGALTTLTMYLRRR